MQILIFKTLLLFWAFVCSAQNVTVPTTCTDGFSPGTDTVLYTVPYTYAQVISIIGNYQNLTWSGNPINTVILNGSDNTVGTARTYDYNGIHVVETILNYSKPANGPYVEIHNTATLIIPNSTLRVYIPMDITVVTETCDAKATTFNLTADFCATNVTEAAGLLHMVHSADVETVGVFLGGQNFTSCAALSSNATTSATPAPYVPNTAATAVGSLMLAIGLSLLIGLVLFC